MWLSKDRLKKLDIHTKSLINKGIYNLYSCDESVNTSQYLLKTNDHQFYLLDSVGNITNSTSEKPKIKIKDTVFFNEVSTTLSVQINAVW
ncbi:MAG: hypothetical protein Q7T91_05220 [Sulfuricurvum sp.]|nr:hypothetical protein [Sulfuricurvum sp.]